MYAVFDKVIREIRGVEAWWIDNVRVNLRSQYTVCECVWGKQGYVRVCSS